ncbi:MAG: undecaprenyl-diphosphate phosphatase [Candidatus Kaiserbacteria bacterium]|nr:undecaprenyl-diphosphate phosphatase [Candidatus Kaiserbacteria bacterium]
MDSVLSLIILAIVQGVTEFLPISSSAHLVLAGELLGSDAHHSGIAIILHGATLTAVIAYFRKDIYRLMRAIFSRTPSKDRSMAGAVLLGTLPIALVGFFVYPVLSVVRTLPSVALALVVSGVLLILADYSIRKRWIITDIPLWRKGIAIGLIQIGALLPGVSRSGVTIAGGRLFGFSRREATRFSFLLAIPAILGALVLFFIQTPLSALSFGGTGLGTLLLVVCIAGAVSYITIHYFLRWIERMGFVPFFVYQVLLGVALLLVSVL